MNKKQFGQLVAILRNEIRNEFDEPLTQYDLAELAHISIFALMKIEQGRSINQTPEMLLNLAIALQLPACARQVFLLASLGLEDNAFIKQPLTSDALLPDLTGKLSNLQTPALIADAFGDVIVSTPALLEVFDLDLEAIRAPHLLSQFNLYRLLFAPEFLKQRAMLGDSQQDFLHRMVLFFKMISLKYRIHWYFKGLLPELNRFPLFREQWQSPFRQDDEIINTQIPFSLNHPRYGNLKFLSSPHLTISGYGDLYLFSFQALDTHTTDACTQIIKTHGLKTFQNSVWPKPEVVSAEPGAWS